MFDNGIALSRYGRDCEETTTTAPISLLLAGRGNPVTEPAGTPPSVHISPCTTVRRRAAGWQNSLAELVQATQTERLVTEYHGPWHLLVAYENGARHDG